VTLEPLATVGDLEDRLGKSITNQAQAEAWMRDASALIRRYTRQQFTRVENDVVVLRVDRQSVFLPQRPADKPTNIVYADGQGVVSVSAWWFNGLDQVDFTPPAWLLNGPAFNHLRRPTTVQITYSHGYATIPDDIISITCSVVGRVAAAPGIMPGLRQGALDDFSFALGGNLVTGALQLLPDEKSQLDVYKSRPRSVMMR
jgi:hypothetical protein